MAVPAGFRSRIASHNRYAIVMAVLSLLGAVVLWHAAAFLFILALLAAATAARGDFGPRIPDWMVAAAVVLAICLFVWGAVDQFIRRYHPVSDRSIIGWHLIGDLLLLPVRITYAVWGNLSMIRHLNDRELETAWILLVTIYSQGSARLSGLTVVEPDARRLRKLLAALQLAGYTDLRRGEQDWFYSVRSSESEGLRQLLDHSAS